MIDQPVKKIHKCLAEPELWLNQTLHLDLANFKTCTDNQKKTCFSNEHLNQVGGWRIIIEVLNIQYCRYCIINLADVL